MKSFNYFFRRLRVLTGLVATLIFFVTVLLPPVLGLITRELIVDQVNAWQRSGLAELNIHSLRAESVRTGWFSSEIHIHASGPVFSPDGQSPASRSGSLHINHGPVIWHLSDSLLALADVQLLPGAGDSDPAQHFSGSAIVKLTPALEVRLDLIAGINASGGDHWIELRRRSPLLPLVGTRSQQLWLDLDMAALTAAGLDQYVERWQREENARKINNRLLFYIGPQ